MLILLYKVHAHMQNASRKYKYNVFPPPGSPVLLARSCNAPVFCLFCTTTNIQSKRTQHTHLPVFFARACACAYVVFCVHIFMCEWGWTHAKRVLALALQNYVNINIHTLFYSFWNVTLAFLEFFFVACCLVVPVVYS